MRVDMQLKPEYKILMSRFIKAVLFCLRSQILFKYGILH